MTVAVVSLAVAYWGGAGRSQAPVSVSNRAASTVPTISDLFAGLPKDDLLLRVDRGHALPSSWAPLDLEPLPEGWTVSGFGAQRVRREAATALLALLAAARNAGHELRVRSAYRSYDEQASTYRYWVEELGEREASRTSAKAGFSEHQLGTAIDLTSARVAYDLVEEFGATPEGRWLADNAYRYGFTVSYPRGKEAVTAYAYEPWHVRYIGMPAAERLGSSGLTLTEALRTTE